MTKSDNPVYDDAFFENLSLMQKTITFTEIVMKELKQKPILVLCIIGATITRLLSVLFSTYLILWIQTFAERNIINSKA